MGSMEYNGVGIQWKSKHLIKLTFLQMRCAEIKAIMNEYEYEHSDYSDTDLSNNVKQGCPTFSSMRATSKSIYMLQKICIIQAFK